MKICIACTHTFDAATWQCPSCFFSPTMLHGYPAFSPELAEQHDGFNPTFFNELASLEEKNFWFQARNRLIVWALQRYFPHSERFLEIGCGTGFVLSGIQKARPEIELYGSEIFSAGLAEATQRMKAVNLIQMDARAIPFENEFDVIGAFDVLEHIVEDEVVLQQLYRAVKPQGGIILTVPQHPFLWSMQDEHACHVRRYTARELKNKVIAAGFNVVKTTSFVSLLLPLMLASRYAKRHSAPETFDVLAELKLSAVTNKIFEIILNVERHLIRLSVPLLLGGSLLLIAKKVE